MGKTIKKNFIWLKVLLGIGGLILLVVLVINPLIKNSLAMRIKDKLIGNFYYSYENLKVDLISRSVTFDNVTWKFPKDTTVFNHEGHIKRVKITGVSFMFFLKGNHIRIQGISLDSLESITQIETPIRLDSVVKLKKDPNPFNYYNLIKGQLESLEVDKITIINGTATWLNAETNKVWRKIESVQFEIQDIALDSAVAANNNGWFSFKEATLEGTNGEIYLPDSLHKIRLKKFQVDYTMKSINVDSLEIIPLVTQSEMLEAKYFQTDRLELTTYQISARGVDMKKLMVENKMRIEHILIDNPILIAFRDKNAHTHRYRYMGMPQMRIKYLPLNMRIDSISLIDGYIRYEEVSEITQEKGEVFFTKLNANLYNLTNDSLSYLENPHATINVSARLLDKSRLVGDFTFNLLSTNGDHWISGSMGQFELTDFNSVFVPLCAVSIRSGHIDKMDFDVRLNNDVADGKITFLYSDLKIDKLDKDHLKNKQFDNVVKSLLANAFILKQSNPTRSRDPRIGIIHFKRAKDKSIFNFWWKAILDGMKSTVLTSEESR